MYLAIKYFLPRKGNIKPNGAKETRETIPDKKMIEERLKESDEMIEKAHF